MEGSDRPLRTPSLGNAGGTLAMKAERHTQVTGYRIPTTLSERVHVPSNNKNLSGRGTARWEWCVIAEFKAPQIVRNLNG
jgi:hypothetical protein